MYNIYYLINFYLKEKILFFSSIKFIEYGLKKWLNYNYKFYYYICVLKRIKKNHNLYIQ